MQATSRIVTSLLCAITLTATAVPAQQVFQATETGRASLLRISQPTSPPASVIAGVSQVGNIGLLERCAVLQFSPQAMLPGGAWQSSMIQSARLTVELDSSPFPSGNLTTLEATILDSSGTVTSADFDRTGAAAGSLAYFPAQSVVATFTLDVTQAIRQILNTTPASPSLIVRFCQVGGDDGLLTVGATARLEIEVSAGFTTRLSIAACGPASSILLVAGGSPRIGADVFVLNAGVAGLGQVIRRVLFASIAPPTSILLPNGCEALIDPTTATVLVDQVLSPAALNPLRIHIPDNPALVGLELVLQEAIQAPALGQGFVLSSGVLVRIGI